MADCRVSPENHSADGRRGKWRQTEREHRCTKRDFCHSPAEVLRRKFKTVTDVIRIGVLGHELLATWPGDVLEVQHRLTDAGRERPACDNTWWWKLDDWQKHGKLAEGDRDDPLRTVGFDKKR